MESADAHRPILHHSHERSSRDEGLRTPVVGDEGSAGKPRQT
jgi:hypothetical protein